MEICVDQASRIDNNMDLPFEQGHRAIEVLLDSTDRLKRIIAGLGLCAADAEDVLQDLSVEAIKRQETFTSENQAAAWLTRVAINLCMDRHRRKKRFTTAAKKMIQRFKHQTRPSSDPQLTAIHAERLELVRAALKNLDESMLGPLVLKYFGGLNSVQIAETLDINPSTVRSRIRNARLALAKALMDKGIEK
jgi:RNA polymerase sigma-70 factor (ECF subfamily)